jgi:drug/metabolite transporter (DMT)-like permease
MATEIRVEKPLKIFLFACIATTLFALLNVLVKLVTETNSVPQAMFFRNCFAMLPVCLLVWYKGGRNWSLVKTNRLGGHFMRSFVGVISMGCFFLSFAMLPLADATAIHFAAPLVLTALSVPMLKEHVGGHRWAAVVIGLVAVIFMIGPAGGGNITGSLVALSAAVLSAFAMIAIRKLGTTEHSLTIVFYFTLFSTVFTGIAMIFAWEPLGWKAFLMMAGIGIFGGIGQIFLTYCYAHAPVAFVSPFNYLAIVFAAAFDILLWGKIPDWHIAVGSTVVIATGLYIVYREHKLREAEKLRTSLYALQPVSPTEEDRKEPL